MKFASIIIFLAIIENSLYAGETKAVKSLTQTEPLVASIDFQKHFEKDSVSLSIENNKIFENEVITTAMDVGWDYALLKIRIHRINTFKYRIKWFSAADRTGPEKSMEIDLHRIQSKKRLKLLICINGIENYVDVDLRKGKYIGISKWAIWEKERVLDVYQRKNKFIYM